MSIGEEHDGVEEEAQVQEQQQQQQRAFTVLYGTQTGNAQDVATRIARQARRRRIHVVVKSMDEYDVTDLIAEPLVFLVLSTTGQGDFPPAALRFWHFLLRADLPPDILSEVTFATFGLGDTSYKRYCWPIRKLGRRLRGLGAQELLPGAEADDQHFLGIDGALQPWLEQVWDVLDQVMPLPDGVDAIPDDVLLEPEIAVSLAEGPRASSSSSPSSSSSLPSSANGIASSSSPVSKEETVSLPEGWQWATLTRNERMTAPDHFQDVRLLSLQGEGKGLAYAPGDVVSLRPANLAPDVDRFLTRMGWLALADEPLAFDPHPPPLPPGCPSRPTLRDVCVHHLDFLSVPRQSFFEAILPFSKPGSLQREKLQEYVTPGEGADDMYEYAQRVRRTILEVLEEFTDVAVPLRHVLDVVPAMRARDFSIASAPQRHRGGDSGGEGGSNGKVEDNGDGDGDGDGKGNTLELAVAVVRYRTRLKAPRRGVLTLYLASLDAPVRVPIQLKRGTFRLPSSSSSSSSPPCIFVGPGTGIAPMRSLLLARLGSAPTVSPQQQQQQPQQGAEDLVFAGCRYAAKDFLFGSELRQLAADARLGGLFLAASRDAAATSGAGQKSATTTAGKFYVQDAIRAQGARVRRLVLHRGAWVFVSGSSGKMPEAVRQAVVDVLASASSSEEGEEDNGGEGGENEQALGQAAAEAFVATMEREGRWQEECWS
ncbi:hypothetical protein FA10DRAFT_273327 [Acaromyces ingoldii]|uniref:NADPH-dependent diflavin oxidoreductase 1 n=1 Tax=Acaromyces ingoldii TaxID=215250 RepID=A0A316YH06_9BASI|nr:hypothetical protein FA10DRAFT_273327 [Acaromyces ingoldii]PWN87025.1 hypothetical protein FA10DRAFT_273327 [Acaromyces ingoldii]